MLFAELIGEFIIAISSEGIILNSEVDQCNNAQYLADKGTYACHPGRRLSGGLTAVVSGHPGLRLRLFVHFLLCLSARYFFCPAAHVLIAFCLFLEGASSGLKLNFIKAK
jgi:hypothetical protein